MEQGKRMKRRSNTEFHNATDLNYLYDEKDTDQYQCGLHLSFAAHRTRMNREQLNCVNKRRENEQYRWSRLI